MKNRAICVIAALLTVFMSSAVFADEQSDETGKITEFSNDFENTEYYEPAAEYGEFYQTERSGSSIPYIKNAGEYKGNASNSSYIIDGDIYEDQYKDGVLQHPASNVYQTANNKYSMPTLKSDNMRLGGLDGYIGFFSRYSFLSTIRCDGFDGTQNLLVTDDGNDNHILRMSPVNVNATANGEASFFGKTNLSLYGRTTCFEFDVNISNEGNGVRLSIVKDGNLENALKEGEANRFGNVNVTQMLRNNGKAVWYDAVTFKNGSIYLGNDINGTEVGAYELDSLYKVKYYLNLENGVPYNMVVVEHDGNVVSESGLIEINDSNAKTSVKIMAQHLTNAFSFDYNGKNDFAYVLSAEAKGSKNTEYADMYIDNLKFGEADKFEMVSAADKYLNNPIPFLGTPRAEIEFNYPIMQSSLADNVSVKDSLGNSIPVSVTANGTKLLLDFEPLQASSSYSVVISENLCTSFGTKLGKNIEFRIITRDKLSFADTTLSQTASGLYDLELKVQNNSTEDLKMVIVVAVKHNDALAEPKIRYCASLVTGNTEKTVKVEGINIPVESGTVEVFVIDSFSGLRALSSPIMLTQ